MRGVLTFVIHCVYIYIQILEGVRAKKPSGNNIICQLLQGPWLHAHSLPKETVAAIMMLYKNTKVKVHSPDGDTDYFDIIAGVLQGDTLAPYCLSSV